MIRASSRSLFCMISPVVPEPIVSCLCLIIFLKSKESFQSTKMTTGLNANEIQKKKKANLRTLACISPNSASTASLLWMKSK